MIWGCQNSRDMGKPGVLAAPSMFGAGFGLRWFVAVSLGHHSWLSLAPHTAVCPHAHPLSHVPPCSHACCCSPKAPSAPPASPFPPPPQPAPPAPRSMAKPVRAGCWLACPWLSRESPAIPLTHTRHPTAPRVPTGCPGHAPAPAALAREPCPVAPSGAATLGFPKGKCSCLA